MTLRLGFLPLLAAALLLAARPAAAQPAAAQPAAAGKVYTVIDDMPQLPGTEGVAERPDAAVQRLLRLPPGTAVPAGQRVIAKFIVEPDGRISSPQMTVPGSPAVNAAVLEAIRQLPRFRPGRVAGRPVRVAVAVGVWPGGLPASELPPPMLTRADDSLEAHTLRRGLTERRAGEAVADFLARVLPVSAAAGDKPISYAWHPGAYGPQLFFSAPGRGPAEYESHLFVLDPVGPTTYAVQILNLGSQGDYTSLAALFFADANHDGQKDLLALTECSLREGPGRVTHYQTTAFYYRGLDGAGRPRYEEQYLENLDELATAAEVRQQLAAPLKRPPAPAAKAGRPARH